MLIQHRIVKVQKKPLFTTIALFNVENPHYQTFQQKSKEAWHISEAPPDTDVIIAAHYLFHWN
jgi:hypothetical protein